MKSNPKIRFVLFTVIASLAIALIAQYLYQKFYTGDDSLALPEDWEIHWFVENKQRVDLPVEYWSEKESRSLVYPAQSLQMSHLKQQFRFTFPEGTDFADCQLQGHLERRSSVKLLYNCTHPIHKVKQAVIEASLIEGYNPGEWFIEGNWVGALQDESSAKGRIQIVSKPRPMGE